VNAVGLESQCLREKCHLAETDLQEATGWFKRFIGRSDGVVPEVSRKVDEREPRWRSTKPTEVW
jgi:hypothetical protein